MTKQITYKPFEHNNTLPAIADQIKTAISCIPGAKIIEEKIVEGRTSDIFISFAIPHKGYWIATTNLTSVLESRACIYLYCMSNQFKMTPVEKNAKKDKIDIPYTICEAIEESPTLIHSTPYYLTTFEIPHYVNNFYNQ